jgi:hypothetical protein
LRDRGPGVLQRRARADAQRAVGQPVDALQLGHVADVEHVAEVLELLVDPQADVGRAREQPRLRPRGALGGQRLQRARRVEAVDATVECRVRRRVVQRRVGLQRSQLRRDRGRIQPLGRQREHALAGIEDRPVAGAAAQVAGQVVGQLGARRPRAGLAMAFVDGGHRHRESGCAEAALRAVAIDQRLLNRVQRIRRAEVLDRQQGLAIDRGQEADAGIDRAKAQRIGAGADHGGCRRCRRVGRQFGHQHRAGAAVALVAAFLGASAVRVLAQPVEHAARDGRARDLHDLAAVHESDGSGVHGEGLCRVECLKIARQGWHGIRIQR